VSKSYVLNIAKNFHRGAKVTLLVLAFLLLLAGRAGADEPQTLVTTNGHRFEKARVTEVTPTTITIVHSCGVARMPLSEFPADVQKKYGYDEAKAKAWIAEQEKLEQARRDAEAKQKTQAMRRGWEQVRAIEDYVESHGELRYDPVTKSIYDADAAAARRAEAFRYLQHDSPPKASQR
jgi:type IV secretory pathway VirB9-like protein